MPEHRVKRVLPQSAVKMQQIWRRRFELNHSSTVDRIPCVDFPPWNRPLTLNDVNSAFRRGQWCKLPQIIALHSPRPFWPRGSPSPPAGAWVRWNESFIHYVNLLPILNNSSLTEVLKLKLFRLLLGENGQTIFDARRPNEASSLEDALVGHQ